MVTRNWFPQPKERPSEPTTVHVTRHNSTSHFSRHKAIIVMADVPLQVISDNAASERRITPSWSISQLRAKLEPITGIPPSSQLLSLHTGTTKVTIEAPDEDSTRLSIFSLTPYAELHVSISLPRCLAACRLARLPSTPSHSPPPSHSGALIQGRLVGCCQAFVFDASHIFEAEKHDLLLILTRSGRGGCLASGVVSGTNHTALGTR